MKASKPLEILKSGTIPLVVAFVGVAGGVIGTLVGSNLTAQHQTAKDITERRVAAYKKFFAGQAKLLQSWSPNLTEENKKKLNDESDQAIDEARFEIGAFGSPEVIRALVNWFDKKGRTDLKNLWMEDIKIYQAMRREIFGKRDDINDSDLYYLLFGHRPVKE